MSQPTADRPEIPEYGVPESHEGLVSWEWARKRLELSLIYWMATTRPNGRPHSVPLWGVWLDDHLFFDGGAHTRHLRNLAECPWASVHLESGTEVVILEGRVEPVASPDPQLAARLSASYTDKYREEGYAPEPGAWDEGGLYRFQPARGWAWRAFPQDATRFHF
ncbi:MAG: pyridoxamine 5'-phosphate oxidase family protein [Acidimicrobiia bacterium]